jgi:hypothetical protein
MGSSKPFLILRAPGYSEYPPAKGPARRVGVAGGAGGAEGPPAHSELLYGTNDAKMSVGFELETVCV